MPRRTVAPPRSRHTARALSATTVIAALVAASLLGAGAAQADPAQDPTPTFSADASPRIVGSATAGSSVTLAAPDLTPTPDTLTYSWSLDGAPLGAPSSDDELALDSTMVGHSLAGEVTAAAPGYTDYVASSDPVVVGAEPVVAGSALTLPSSAQVGVPIVPSAPTFTPSSAAVAYQWKRDGVAVAGATEPQYTPVAADVGTILSVVVEATAPGHLPFSSTSTLGSPVAPGFLAPPTSVEVSGDPRVGSPLQATASTTPGSSLTWAWSSDGAVISGAVRSTYTPTSSDRGTTLRARAVATRSGYAASSATESSPTGTVVEDVATPTPTISGTPRVGQTLKALPGLPSPGASFSYVWLRGGSQVLTETDDTYQLTAADAGYRISVNVTADGPDYLPKTVRSSATAPVTGSMRTTTAPRVTGTTVVGSTLTVHAGAYAPAPTATAYQWLRDGVSIGKATNATYRLTSSDVGATVSVRVSATRAYYDKNSVIVSAASRVRGVFTTHAAVITGTRQVGKTFSASFPTWSPAPSAKSYQWYRNGSAVPGARSSRYTLSGADAGKSISVTITGARAGYVTASRTTQEPGTIAKAAAPRATKAPHLSGTARNGSTLTVTNGSWNVSGLTPHYTWYRSGAQIAKAASKTYKLTSADVGKTISARVTVTKPGYANGSAGSNTTGKVAKATASFKGDGVFKVGRDIPTGTFYSTGGGLCYWSRLSSASTSSYITNDLGNGQRIMTIESTDAYVELRDCGTWYRIALAGPAKTTIPSSGTFKVNQQIVPGTYQAHYGDSCYWARLSAGSTDSYIDNDFESGPGYAYVTIESSDFSFETSDCGTWTKVG